MYFKQFIFRNIIYLAVCFVIIPQLAFATQPVRMLTVTGAAAVKVKPNQAKLTWTIEARADAPASAMFNQQWVQCVQNIVRIHFGPHCHAERLTGIFI